MMKLLICLLVMLLPAAGLAEGAMELPNWLELSGENRVLTVRLPWDAEDACDWSFESSDPAMLDLLTMETLGDEPDEDGAMWVASFMGMGGASGEARLTLRYGEDGPAPQEIRTVQLNMDETGAMALACAEIFSSAESWYAIDADEFAVNVCLPANPSTGYAWRAESSDPALLTMTSETYLPDPAGEAVNGAGGTWMSSFAWTADQPSDVTLTLRYAREWESVPIETRELRLSVDADGRLRVVSVEIEK